ncbi:ATP-grasp domain-containing protein [Salinicoccus bachuensis]|uniref:ATP-grasp domain-containing protein n=1 Tax=Salinicoccus bachuensis TaxID=3136731 RepID=A0ABZ3CK94_9STAP
MRENQVEYIIESVSDLERNRYKYNVELDSFNLAVRTLEDMGKDYEFLKEGKNPQIAIYNNGRLAAPFKRHRYPSNADVARKICDNKISTENFLKANNIMTTNSKVFNASEFSEARNYAYGSQNAIVIKPLNLSGGKGVSIDVKKEDFEYAWNYAVKAQQDSDIENPKVIIQDMVDGFEIRFTVIEGLFFSATLRMPAYVVGDGKSSVDRLIDQKNKIRKRSGYFKKMLIRKNEHLDHLLSSKGFALDSVLDEGEPLLLHRVSNTHFGGETFNITHLVSKELKEQAENAIAAIPGLHTAGLDMMIRSFEDTQGTVIETNFRPAFQFLYYPYKGAPVDPLKYHFEIFFLEDSMKQGELNINDLTPTNQRLLKARYSFLYKKQQYITKAIQTMNLF